MIIELQKNGHEKLQKSMRFKTFSVSIATLERIKTRTLKAASSSKLGADFLAKTYV